MEIKNKSILKLSDGRNYLVQKRKEIEGRNVLLLQELDEGDFFFGIELSENGETQVHIVPDKEVELRLAEMFKNI